MKDHVSGGTEGDRKRRSLKTPRSRSLSLEPLETRALLSATDWGGFDGCPDRNDYSVLQSEIDIDLSGIDPDLVAMADFNQDGKDDLVIVCHDDTTPEITLFLGDGTGAFQRSITTSLITTNVVGTLLADVTGDALPDFITFSQNSIDGSILNIDLYAARSDGSFAFSKTSEVSLSVFGNYSTYVIAGVNGVYLGDSMVIQLQNSYAFDSVGNYYSLNGAAYASNDGTGGFLALRLFSSLTGTAKGSVTIDSIDYLVSQNLSTRTFQFGLLILKRIRGPPPEAFVTLGSKDL